MAKINKATAGIMLAAVISGGAVGAAAIPAMAADTTGSSTAAATDGYGNGYGTPGGGSGGGAGGPHQANGKTEEVLTGDTATKVEAAVKAAQPNATIERMETDADGAVYEAHITKADGSRATVLLDANFTVTETQDQGQGGGRGGPNDGDADDAAASGSTSNG